MPDAKPLWGKSFLEARASDKKSDIYAKDEPWTDAHESARATNSLDDFMNRNGYAVAGDNVATKSVDALVSQNFIQQSGEALTIGAPISSGLSADEDVVVNRSLKSAAAFMQAHHTTG